MLVVMLATRALFTGALVNVPLPPDADLVAMYNGGEDGTPEYAIGAAARVDGVWTKDGDNPLLTKGAASTWEDTHIKDQWLVWDGSQLVLFYAGSADGYPQYQIGRATAPAISGPWTKYNSNPILTEGAGGAWDDESVLFPVVLYEPDDTGREWKMWYAGHDGSNLGIGYAHSSDGISWTKHGRVISIGSGGSWNDVGVIPGAIVKEGSTYYLFAGGYQDASNPRWQGGLWTFTDPEGTYTASGDNPILQARFNDAGTSQPLTANLSIGNASASVASTAAFSVGEPVVVSDTNSAPFHTRIDSIESGTALTLADDAPTDYTTAASAVLRPMTYNAVYPRTVRRVPGGGWEMWIVAHQATIDLTTGSLNYQEATMRATASALTATSWSYDHDLGVLFPLGPSGSRWDAISAENITVVVAP